MEGLSAAASAPPQVDAARRPRQRSDFKDGVIDARARSANTGDRRQNLRNAPRARGRASRTRHSPVPVAPSCPTSATAPRCALGRSGRQGWRGALLLACRLGARRSTRQLREVASCERACRVGVALAAMRRATASAAGGCPRGVAPHGGRSAREAAHGATARVVGGHGPESAAGQDRSGVGP